MRPSDSLRSVVAAPRLADYTEMVASFTWEQAWADLGGPPDAEFGVNIADRAVDRHVRAGRGDVVALRFLQRVDLDVSAAIDITFADLALRTNRFAGALVRRGHDAGTGVASLAGRIPELYVAALGTLKAQAVFTPLFSAFGPDPIAQRMNLGRIKVLVTTPTHFRRKIMGIVDRLPALELVVIAGGTADEIAALDGATPIEVVGFEAFLASESDDFEVRPTSPESPALLHFTSGTTGAPKGAVHVHGAVVMHHITGQYVLDMHPGDVYWCTADPGWVTGMSYGIISPLTNGVTSIIDEAEFDAERWYRILQDLDVDVFYTAPTAIRMLERLGEDVASDYRFGSLRLLASVGEPLDAESVEWCERVFGVPVLDTWWQTETGGIMIANYRSERVRRGSMGRPVPGTQATVLERDADEEIVLDADGHVVQITDPGAIGEIGLRAGWPSMFRTYLDREEKYKASFVDGWYRTGDLARRDTDGYYWFVGRGDDLIKTSGHLVGPFEVESALDEHPAVVEAGVIGKPDEAAGAVVKAFVVLAGGREPTEELRRELIGHARKRLGAAVAPREIEFVDHLPHTRSGKIMRRVLKAREMGEDVGDLSTLETPTPTPTPTSTSTTTPKDSTRGGTR